MKIGQLVKTYVGKVFRYCDEVDHEELVRLMDARYSKDAFGINYPFCAEVETVISRQLQPRYWREIHVVRGKTFRVCSQWRDLPTSKSRELFCRYLLSKRLAVNEEVSAIDSRPQPSRQISTTEPPQRAARGRYRGNAIGNAQNLFVRNILSNIGRESFNENDWQAAKAYFMNKCAYCGAETDLIRDHATNRARISAGGRAFTKACNDAGLLTGNNLKDVSWLKSSAFNPPINDRQP
jgi:hypothetical protein